MPVQSIDLSAQVESQRERDLQRAQKAAAELVSWTTDPSAGASLHRYEAELFGRLMGLGCHLVALWWSSRLPTRVPRVLRRFRCHYAYRDISADVVRTRFGIVWTSRPVYELVSGKGAPLVAPVDRQMGLAAGRMSLGVHLLTAWLVAQTTFDSAIDVLGRLSGYAPSKRSSLGIADLIGPVAIEYLDDLPAPPDDGEFLVIAVDDKAAPMLGPAEHRKRCRPHRKRPRVLSARQVRRARRRKAPRKRRKTGDKSKNGRSAKLAVVYTLRRLPDGSLEGPINRRVLGTFGSRKTLVQRLLREARQRGYPHRRTIFLADGAKTLWKIWRKHFPEATPCLDWYHLSEYLWSAGATLHEEGSKPLKKWVQARQEELRADRVDDVLTALEQLRADLDSSGRGTGGRRKRVTDALRYLRNHREQIRYAELIADGLDIGTGVMEGAVKHTVGVRLDGCAMRWSPGRAEFVLGLRLVLVNELWTEFEEHVAQQHERCDAWTVPRVTPQGPRSLDPSCIKAA